MPEIQWDRINAALWGAATSDETDELVDALPLLETMAGDYWSKSKAWWSSHFGKEGHSMGFPVALAERVAITAERASPALIARATSAASRMAGKAITSVKDLVAWAKRSPAAAVMIASSLVEAGVSVDELLADKKQDLASNPDTRHVVAALEAIEAAADKELDGLNPARKYELGSVSDGILMRELIRWAERQFHGRKNAMDQHMFMRLFMDTKTEDLQAGFDLYGVRS